MEESNRRTLRARFFGAVGVGVILSFFLLIISAVLLEVVGDPGVNHQKRAIFSFAISAIEISCAVGIVGVTIITLGILHMQIAKTKSLLARIVSWVVVALMMG